MNHGDLLILIAFLSVITGFILFVYIATKKSPA